MNKHENPSMPETYGYIFLFSALRPSKRRLMREFRNLPNFRTKIRAIQRILYKNMASHNSDGGPIIHSRKRSSVRTLKKIEAIVRRESFPDIDNALKKIGISGLTFFDAEGRGRTKGREMMSDRGTRTYRPEYVERTKLEIIVKDSDAQKVVDVVLKNAKTGSIGDGKVFVCSVEQGYDISSGESGEKSISVEGMESFQVATNH